MGVVRVLKEGVFTTIQDGGRRGYAFYGIPRSGFMDSHSAKAANIIVGNKKNAALIEMALLGGSFAFQESSIFCLSGAEMKATLDGEQVPFYERLTANVGQVLKLAPAVKGKYTYLAIQGKLKLQKILKSRSTYTYGQFGGLDGRRLKSEDILHFENPSPKHTQVQWSNNLTPLNHDFVTMDQGPEYHYLKEPALLKSSYSILPSSDRMGALLQGPRLKIKSLKNFPSQALFPGMIQCTPAGQLIVVLQDGQTTGGYPRVGMLQKKDLDILNQMSPGHSFRFKI